MLGFASLLWTTGSCRALRWWAIRGLTTACLAEPAVTASGATVLSLGETSFLDECPTLTFPIAENAGCAVLLAWPPVASFSGTRVDDAPDGTTLAPTLEPSERDDKSAPKSSALPMREGSLLSRHGTPLGLGRAEMALASAAIVLVTWSGGQ